MAARYVLVVGLAFTMNCAVILEDQLEDAVSCPDDSSSLLQVSLSRSSQRLAKRAELVKTLKPVAKAEPDVLYDSSQTHSKDQNRSARDLVFMHVPYNFGHTVEAIAMYPSKWVPDDSAGSITMGETFPPMKTTWKQLNAMKKYRLRPDAEIWGHMNPDLQVTSTSTGCGLYYTPPKHWPKHIAEKYFGKKKVFGLLRDPYERLVAFFRGGFKDYGGYYPEFDKTCDVNGAVKKMMQTLLDTGNRYLHNCTFLPQAEYFEGKYGITVPVDNRRFPSSMNEVFKNHGYEDMYIWRDQVEHVRGCDNIWAADLHNDTKKLVRKVYDADFKLLCKHFNYCDTDENVCLTQVPHMCPSKAFLWNATVEEYRPNEHGTYVTKSGGIRVCHLPMLEVLLLALIGMLWQRPSRT